jgi:N-acetylneuraminate lyase
MNSPCAASTVLQEQVGNFRLSGLTCAPLTPFDEKGDVNFSVFDKYAQHLVDYGIRNVFVTGTTGEGNSLTVTERKKVAEAWLSVGRGRFSAILIQIGAGCLLDSKELATHAQEIGADAIACVSPTYYKPSTLDSYVSYMAAVANAASRLPFYLYDIDFVTGVCFSAVEFFDAAIPRIPTLRGVKHTSPSFVSMHTLLARHGSRVQVVLGSDETYLEGLAIGLSDNIIQSFMGHLLTRLKEAFDRKDLDAARLEQIRVIQVYDVARKHGLGVPAFPKLIMKLLGIDCGQPRLPVAPYTDSVFHAVSEDLTSIGFFDWATRR